MSGKGMAGITFCNRCFDSYNEYQELTNVAHSTLRRGAKETVWVMLSRRNNLDPFLHRQPHGMERTASSSGGPRYYWVLGLRAPGR